MALPLKGFEPVREEPLMTAPLALQLLTVPTDSISSQDGQVRPSP